MEYLGNDYLTDEEIRDENTENEYNDWLYEQETNAQYSNSMTLQDLLMLRPAEVYSNLEAYSQTREGKCADINFMKSVLDDFSNGYCSAQFLVDELAVGMQNARKNLELNKTQNIERV